MKCAVASENGLVFQHFGKCPAFDLYEIQNEKAESLGTLSSGGSGHSALVTLLAQQGVDLLICGGIGMGARQALEAAGITLYAGISGKAQEAAQALAEGRLVQNAEATCNHHGEEGEHHCHHGQEDHHCHGGANGCHGE